MRVERISLLIVVICAIVALAAPFYRSLAARQLEQTVPGREKSIWNCIDPTIPSPHRKTDAQLLKENPKDFMLRLALAQEKIEYGMTARSKENRRAELAIRAIRRDYPKQGTVYVLALELPEYSVEIPRRFEGSAITPEEAARYFQKPELVTRQQLGGLERCLKLIDEAIAADPGNGWFHYQKALYLYGLKRDTEALRQIHLAAVSPRFTDYTNLRARSLDHVLDLRGGLYPDRRVWMKGMVAFPFFARMREGARITAHLAYKEIRRGDTERGVHIALDLTDASYNMARNAPTFIHGLQGISIQAIGAAALDPAFKSKAESPRVQSRARLARYTLFLTDHGYHREAATLGKHWRQTDRLSDRTRAFTKKGCTDSMIALYRFPVAFATSAGVLAILFTFAAVWFIAFLFTTRGGGRAFWDKRAAVTAAFLTSLILAPLIADLVSLPDMDNWLAIFLGETTEATLRPVFLLIPLSIMAVALLAGLIVMLKRTPRDGENRRMPGITLLIAYLSAAGGLAYLAYRLDDFVGSGTLFHSLESVSSALMILGPIAATILYALLRAAQFRFGRVRRSAPLTFIATLRYASAIAVGLFAVIYLFTLVLTAHSAVKADSVARASVVKEAAMVQSVFK